MERWHERGDEIDALLERPRWRRLHELLTAGNVEIRVVSRDNIPFLHGKAGLITRPDGTTSSLIGSIYETANGWAQSYEMIWEDPSPGWYLFPGRAGHWCHRGRERACA